MKNLLIIFFLFFSPSLFAQEETFTVSGKIDGLESKTIHIFYKDKSGKLVRDSTVVKDGYFTYSRKIDEMEMLSFYPGNESVMKRVDRGYFPAKSSQFQFIAYPGAKVKFAGKITDFVDAYPSGDPANNDLARLNKSIYPLMNESVNMEVKIAKKIIADSLAVKEAQEKIDKWDKEVDSIKKKFIGDHTSSYAAAWLLGDMMLRNQVNKEEAVNLYDKMDQQHLKTNPFFIEVVKRIEGLRATSIGNAAPEINSSHTYDKKPFNLTSLKGKYVVLDFWGTWCGPCISGMPKMKEYLDKYKDKMDIVGIAQESDDGTNWRKFLDKNSDYQWHQVLSRNDEDYILKYSVAGFPTKIIIDPQGKIVARFVGEDDDIYKKLDEILK
ncbi:MAG TPA: TlpA disulfide reductase family protein [Chitinophagaceae bacterium]|nr:TlpA disulfide reductase family protein [Chitinophagaceae bacterium]